MNELLSEKCRKARKEHKCCLCNGLIQKGETYRWSKNVYDGTIYELHEHEACSEICSAIWDYVDPDEGMSDQDFQDGCQEVCRCFICPDCPRWNGEYMECEDDESYCLDKMTEFFKSHELYRDGRNKYGGEIWKIREKEIRLNDD